MRLLYFCFALILFFMFIFSCESDNHSLPHINILQEELSPLLDLALSHNRIPKTLDKNKEIKWVDEPYDWTEGFWSGICWMLFKETSLDKWKKGAETSQNIFINHKNLTTDHDIGFIFNNSYGKGYRITGNKKYKQIMIDAAQSLSSRFNGNIGCIQSWDCVDNWQTKRGWKFPVIIDNLMNLEILFEATKLTGETKYEDIAIRHALTTMEYHFREDGSAYHVVDYDPLTGSVRSKETAQGYADESTWARGQAWALYGYTMCYRYTGNERFLIQAERIYDYIINHPNYPEDGIPYWDFDVPNISTEPRDASAAAIMASAMIELDEYSEINCLKQAGRILRTLSSNDFLKDDTQYFLLNHSIGSIPHGNEIDVPLVYADYYYLEALIKMKNISND